MNQIIPDQPVQLGMTGLEEDASETAASNKRLLSNTTTPERTQAKRNKHDKNDIAPIIFFRIDEKYFKNKKHLVEDFLITLDSKIKILNNTNVFSNCKRLDLDRSQKQNPTLVVKGISANDLNEHYNELVDKGVVDVIEIKNKNGEQINISKIVLASDEIKSNLLDHKKIIVNRVRYSIEEVAKPPKRCTKTDHTDENCPSLETQVFKCVNCGENHSSFYKGCIEYKQRDKANITEINSVNNKNNLNNIQPGFYRNYSEATNPNNNQDKILAKLYSIEANLNERIKELESKIEDAKSETVNDLKQTIDNKIKDVYRMLKLNNSRMFHFFLDIIKIMCPGIKKPNKNQIQALLTQFKQHESGTGPDSNKFTSYCEALFKA
ncbi:unnamed protein product [Brachionus calyciflorus]|uniref:Uncharacterized protein n=1 Tax=Brachionus calyciflorus TaxID=104777 RepID=A0A813V7Z0_9BILA|nr:unnamed protein product [Brachionus calyciflorus]